MKGVRIAKVAEVAELNPPLPVKIDLDEDVAFLPMAAVAADLVVASNADLRRYGEVNKGYTTFVSGDVLVAKITPCFENGKIAQAQIQVRAGVGSTEFHVLRARSEELDARYLTYFLRQKSLRVEGERKMTGSAGQRRVPEHFLAGLNIPVPSIAEQRRIAEILDKADALRAKRRAALAQLDSLTQSIFLDMFGDPAINPRKLPISRIGDLLDSASYGTSEKAGADGEFPVLRMGNITATGEIDLSNLKYMDLESDLFGRYLVRKGDVLFNRTNSAELVGKTAIFREEKAMAYAGYLVRLRVNDENDPEYLSAFLNTSYAKAVLRGMCKSIIGMANINAQEVQAIKIARPPFREQQEFSRRIQLIEGMRKSFRAHLAQLDSLFISLQQRAFNGGL